MDKFIKIIAAETNLDLELVEKVIRSEFKFVADTMEQGNFESVHLHYFGKFAVKPNRLIKWNEYNEKNN